MKGFRTPVWHTLTLLLLIMGRLGSIVVADTIQSSLTIDTGSYPGVYLKSGTTNLAAFRVDSSTGILDLGDIYGSAPALGLRIFTNDLERLRIDSSGDVGIGTPSPYGRLHVSGGNLSVDVNRRIQTYPNSIGGVGMGLTMWSADTSVAGEAYGRPGFVGRNLYWDGSQFVAASTDSNANWGTITGVLATNTDIRLITRAASQQGYNYGLGPNIDALTRLTVTTDGLVGVGTASPRQRMSVVGGALNVGAEGDYYGAWLVGAQSTDSYLGLGEWHNRGGYVKWVNSARRLAIYTTAPTEPVTLQETSGNVGIGTTNPTHTLSVNGTIKAKEVIVETTGWADDVFAPDYALPSLDSVAQHIAEKRHLPGIPSAAEVAEHGVAVGDMQAALLRKVEELTLYMLETRKQLAATQAENAALRAEVDALRATLTTR